MPGSIQEIRAAHHAAAKLVALGKEPDKIALITGHTPTMINLLKQDPAFQQLVAHYKHYGKKEVA